MKTLFCFAAILIFAGCSPYSRYAPEDFSVATRNGRLANESYVRSLRFVNAWMERADSASGLIPTNMSGKKDIWEPFNAAADNYAFMVLTTWLLDSGLYNGAMLDMLNTERKLTSRIKSLPDAYRFSTRDFVSEEPDTTWIVFHASEYIKDGLIPLAEYIGESPWNDRLMEMLDDLAEFHTVIRDVDQMGGYKAVSEEINGSMLQSLVRMYWMTGRQEYLDRAVVIGDYYLTGERDLSALPYLRLRDHGCEIIGGLSELYVTLHFVQPEKKKQYQPYWYKVLDRILEVGRNEDHLFYNAINAATGEVADGNVADTWGYTFNAYYAVYMIDNKEEYRQAVLEGVSLLNEKYRSFVWEGKSHDGYADAIESGINLLNREAVPSLAEWIDSEMKVMWGMQQENGIIGGAHPDGNFARTAIMYALWKSMGVHIIPWRPDVMAGAELNDGKLLVFLRANEAWSGKLTFDYSRHKEILNLPVDYPRINQFPEWYTVEGDQNYEVLDITRKTKSVHTGNELKNGITVRLGAGEEVHLVVSAVK